MDPEVVDGIRKIAGLVPLSRFVEHLVRLEIDRVLGKGGEAER